MAARIYVQIPAYRDQELLPTVTNLLATAHDPGRLTIGVAWQYAPGEQAVGRALERLPGGRVIAIPAAESQGCNWARRVLQDHWDGEEFTLFLDSHHRFVPGWDELLVRMFEVQREAGVERPLLTGYLPPYDPARDPAGRVHAVYRMAVAERVGGMPFRLTGHAVPGWDRLTAPVPAAFASLHLLFAEGRFNAAVPFDPAVYFFADEVAVAVRAFTHGYDLLHPHVVLGWHLYDRRTRTTHWADHADGHARHRATTERLRRLYRGELAGELALGDARTVQDYETHAHVTLLADDVGRP